MAAVLYWRLPALTPTNPGPLPWLPGHSTNASCPSCLGRLHGTAIPRADERHAAHTHLDGGTTTDSAHTNNANGVRAGRPRPADSASQSDRAARNVRRSHMWAGRMASASHAEPRPGIRFPSRRCGSGRARPPRRTP
jgi:hypothetical protein